MEPDPASATFVMARAPRHAHFLWTGGGFSLAHRLAIESLLLTNPGWRATLHLIDEYARTAELERVRADPRVAVRERSAREVLQEVQHVPELAAGALWATYQRIPAKAASARSNLVRYAILWLEGGVYLDLDVLVLRSLEPLLDPPATLGTELVWRADAARVAGERSWWMVPPTLAFAAAIALCRTEGALRVRAPASLHRGLERWWSEAQPNNAVIAAVSQARFLGELLARAPHVDATVRFRLGPTLVTEAARAHPELVRLLPPEVLYCVPPSQSFRFFRAPAMPIPEQALLLHYVSSNHRRELRALAEHGLDGWGPSVLRELSAQVLAGRAPLLAAK